MTESKGALAAPSPLVRRIRAIGIHGPLTFSLDEACLLHPYVISHLLYDETDILAHARRVSTTHRNTLGEGINTAAPTPHANLCMTLNVASVVRLSPGVWTSSLLSFDF